ncbi:MAG TPA: serine hydrolase domain-containing protein [Kofleriaceae bacterium]|nr:serine hydrolase domain-containing protein [Kofleriaceae bacterium]
MLSRRSFLHSAALGLAGCWAHGAAPGEPLDAERARRGIPGAAVAIVTRGAPDELRAVGDLGADSLVEVASLSKPVFAFAVIAEAARGGIDLDAPLSELAPPPYRHLQRDGEDGFDDPRLAQVTPRLLLSHRAGLPNWARDRPLAFVRPPGERWLYSGEGYVLLQRALEARGASLDELVGRNVLSPLGMARSTFDPGVPRARGHDRQGAGVASSLRRPLAAASLLSTARDYARFVRRLVEAPAGDPVVDRMTARQVAVDPARGLAWGVGVALAEPEWMFHWGANAGYRALFVGSRARGAGVVVVTDSDAGMELAARVVREQFGDLPLLGFPMLYPAD